MPPVPSDIPEDLIHSYQEQLAQKDAQIAALTSLLHDSNTLLAQQQRIWESYLAAQGAQSPVAPAPSPDRNAPGAAEHRVHMSAPEHNVSRAPGTSAFPVLNHLPATEEKSLHVPEVLVNSAGLDPLPQNNAAVTPPESRDDAMPARLAPQDVSREQAHPPIPIAYFGSPLAGFAHNLKEAAASKDVGMLPDADDEDQSEEADRRLASRVSNEAQPAGGQPWRQPLLGTLAVVAVVIGVGALWRVLPGIVSRSRNSSQVSAMQHPPVNSLPSERLQTPNVTSTSGPAQPPEVSVPSRAAPKPPASSLLPPLASKPGAEAPAVTTGQETSAPQPTRRSAPNASLNASLIQAVAQADLPRVQRLVAQGADVNARNEHASSVLAMAARQGYDQITMHLLMNGADVNAANDRGWTALMLAVNYDHLKIVQALLQRGARTDLTNSQGTTALMLAAQNGNREIVRLLLAGGAPAMVKNSEGNTAKDLASRNGHMAIAEMLTTATASPR